MARNLKLDLLKETKKNLQQSAGGCGSEIIDGTAAVTGNWFCIVAQESTQLDVSGCTTDIENFPGTDVVIGAGITLFGNWTSVELISGSVIAYEKC